MFCIVRRRIRKYRVISPSQQLRGFESEIWEEIEWYRNFLSVTFIVLIVDEIVGRGDSPLQRQKQIKDITI